MSTLLAECQELKSLPDISKWDTGNVIDLSSMFTGCHNLLFLPYI